MAKNKVEKVKKEKVKTNQRTKNLFIKIIAGMLIVVIACTGVNLIINKEIDKATALSQQGGNITDIGGADDSGVDVDVNGTSVDDNGVTAAPSDKGTQQSVQQNGGQSQTPVQQQTQQQAADNPLSYNKSQIVNYYNQCLRKAYSQPKFTVQKTEVIDVQLGKMLLNGKPATGIQNLANKVVESNKAKGGTDTQSFTSGNAKVDAQKRFILPANLNTAAVRSYNVSKNGAGYIINFTLNEERCNFTTKPPYNSCCTFPLDFTEIDLGGIGQITQAEFYYPGTTLQATIDGNGRVCKTYVVMPLTVKDAKGQGMGQELQMDISGKWLCTNINQF